MPVEKLDATDQLLLDQSERSVDTGKVELVDRNALLDARDHDMKLDDNYDEDDSLQEEGADELEKPGDADKEMATALEEELADIKLRQKMEQIKKLNISLDDGLGEDLEAPQSIYDDLGYEEHKAQDEFHLDDDEDIADMRTRQGDDGGRVQIGSEESKLDPTQNQRMGLQESRNII